MTRSTPASRPIVNSLPWTWTVLPASAPDVILSSMLSLLLRRLGCEKRRLTLTQGSADRHSAGQELAKNEVEDPAVAVVEPLVRGVDTHRRLELDRITVGFAVWLGGHL